MNGKTLARAKGRRGSGWLTKMALPAAGIALALCSAAGTASATPTTGAASPALQKQQAAEAVLAKANFGIGNTTSPNWSGYVDKNYTTTGKFTLVNADWNVPEVASGDCSKGTFATGEGLSGFWVGIDGWGGSTVEQTGTATECYEGTAYYWDWYEMYPKPVVVIGAVNPGDEIKATVQSTKTGYALSINDVTSGAWNYALKACPTGGAYCQNHSAEVVAEAPGGCVSSSGQTCRGTYYPMPDFRWVSFHNILVATQKNPGASIGTSGFGPLDVKMINSAKITLANVSSTLYKNAFNDSWRASG